MLSKSGCCAVLSGFMSRLQDAQKTTSALETGAFSECTSLQTVSCVGSYGRHHHHHVHVVYQCNVSQGNQGIAEATVPHRVQIVETSKKN